VIIIKVHYIHVWNHNNIPHVEILVKTKRRDKNHHQDGVLKGGFELISERCVSFGYMGRMILVLHLQLHCWKHINISGKDYSGIFT
jgi:hypothetical protein